MLLLIMLYKVTLAFESVDETLKCETENNICRELICCCAVYYFYKLVLGNVCFWTNSFRITIWVVLSFNFDGAVRVRLFLVSFSLDRCHFSFKIYNFVVTVGHIFARNHSQSLVYTPSMFEIIQTKKNQPTSKQTRKREKERFYSLTFYW